MEGFESLGHLTQSLPNLHLVEMGVIFYVLVYLFLYVSCIGQLHDNAQTLSSIIKKCLLVVDDVGVRN
jgi:hypothetical protein